MLQFLITGKNVEDQLHISITDQAKNKKCFGFISFWALNLWIWTEPNKQLRMSLYQNHWDVKGSVCCFIHFSWRTETKQPCAHQLNTTRLKFVTIVTMSSFIRRVSAPCDVNIINIFYECLTCYSDSSPEIVLMIIGSEHKQKHWVLVCVLSPDSLVCVQCGSLTSFNGEHETDVFNLRKMILYK